MARSQGGVLGGVSGKFGSVVGYRLRGTDVIRGLPRISKKKPSVKQLAHRERFKLIQQWRSFLTPVFAITFRNHTHERSAQNAAHRLNAEIVTGEYPEYKIDYSRIVISSGNLPGLKDLTVTIDDSRMMHVTWNKYVADGAMHGDLVAFLACFDESILYDASTAAAYRMDGEFHFQLAKYRKAKFVDIYVTVLSDNRERAASSEYLGRVELA